MVSLRFRLCFVVLVSSPETSLSVGRHYDEARVFVHRRNFFLAARCGAIVLTCICLTTGHFLPAQARRPISTTSRVRRVHFIGSPAPIFNRFTQWTPFDPPRMVVTTT